MSDLFPALQSPSDREVVRFGDRALSQRQLRAAAGGVAERLDPGQRVAVWATPALETCVAVVGALAAGAVVVPINPKVGERELEHILGDSEPERVLRDHDVDLSARGTWAPARRAGEEAAFILYTSGTTGPPKGAVIPRRAIVSNLDALAEVWEWTDADVLVHGLPLFHVHGLVLGVLGPVRLGARLHHLVHFSPETVAQALDRGGTMLFGVPTMYHRLAGAAEADAALAVALADARVLVSGSAGLPVREHLRIERATGQRVVERYGLTETLINCSTRVSGEPRPGYVGPPLPGIELRLVDEQGSVIESSDDETIGEVAVRGPNVFTGYLNRPEATAEAVRDGWFYTGDLAARAPDGSIRILGRKATDLIKTGGYKVGAGEIEAALLEHPEVAEAAVTGEPDDDLGERVVAWIVPRSSELPGAEELADHVARLLSPHKRPRDVHLVAELPRNEMGKVQKSRLRADDIGSPGGVRG